MKIEDLVLTIEQSKHLQELGLDMSDAALCWNRQTRTWDGKEPSEWRKKWSVIKNQPLAVMNFTTYESIPTYTLQEVLDKLPTRIEENKGYYPYVDVYDELVRYCSAVTLSEEGTYLDTKDKSDSLLESAYNMLCWVIENGYLEEGNK